MTSQNQDVNTSSEGIFSDAEIQSVEQSTTELATILSQVSWMRFSVVAEPDLSHLAGDANLQKFVTQITQLAVSIVTSQMKEDIGVAISQVVQNMISSVDQRMISIQKLIFEKLAVFNANSNMNNDSNNTNANSNDTNNNTNNNTNFNNTNNNTNDSTNNRKDDSSCPILNPNQQPINLYTLPLTSASWIWTVEAITVPRPLAPHARAFRKTITTRCPVNSLIVDIAADNYYTLYVNGLVVGYGELWSNPDRYLVRFPDTNKVVIAVYAAQGPLGGQVGLIASGKIWNCQESEPAGTDFVTDAQWKAHAGHLSFEEFIAPEYNDSDWKDAFVEGPYGGYPWIVQHMVPTVPGKNKMKAYPGKSGVPKGPNAKPAKVLNI